MISINFMLRTWTHENPREMTLALQYLRGGKYVYESCPVLYHVQGRYYETESERSARIEAYVKTENSAKEELGLSFSGSGGTKRSHRSFVSS
jgi:hypothetical protein